MQWRRVNFDTLPSYRYCQSMKKTCFTRKLISQLNYCQILLPHDLLALFFTLFLQTVPFTKLTLEIFRPMETVQGLHIVPLRKRTTILSLHLIRSFRVIQRSTFLCIFSTVYSIDNLNDKVRFVLFFFSYRSLTFSQHLIFTSHIFWCSVIVVWIPTVSSIRYYLKK